MMVFGMHHQLGGSTDDNMNKMSVIGHISLNLISQIPMSIWLYNDGRTVVASTDGATGNGMMGYDDDVDGDG